jgi:hypothetical protein
MRAPRVTGVHGGVARAGTTQGWGAVRAAGQQHLRTSRAFTLAPLASKRLTMASWPSWQAISSGVAKSLCTASRHAKATGSGSSHNRRGLAQGPARSTSGRGKGRPDPGWAHPGTVRIGPVVKQVLSHVQLILLTRKVQRVGPGGLITGGNTAAKQAAKQCGAQNRQHTADCQRTPVQKRQSCTTSSRHNVALESPQKKLTLSRSTTAPFSTRNCDRTLHNRTGKDTRNPPQPAQTPDYQQRQRKHAPNTPNVFTQTNASYPLPRTHTHTHIRTHTH